MAAQTIYALFQDVEDAERAIGALADRGVARNQIGIAVRRAAEVDETVHVRNDFARVTSSTGLSQAEPVTVYEPRPGTLPPAALAATEVPTSTVDTPQNVESVGKDGITTTTGADAMAGAAVGTGVGLIAGVAAAAVALAIPGVGLILAGGALATAFGLTAGTTLAGAAVGGTVGYLRDMGMSAQAASHFADRLHEGDYLLTAVIDSEHYDDMKNLLLKYNAAGVDMEFAVAGEPDGQPAPDPISTTPVVI